MLEDGDLFCGYMVKQCTMWAEYKPGVIIQLAGFSSTKSGICFTSIEGHIIEDKPIYLLEAPQDRKNHSRNLEFMRLSKSSIEIWAEKLLVDTDADTQVQS